MQGSDSETIEAAKNAATSIAVDETNNNPCIVYGKTSGQLGYALWTGSEWTKETIDNNSNTGNSVSICMHQGIPHISYIDANNSYLKYATQNVGTEENHKFVSLPELKITPNPAFSKFHIIVDRNGKEFEVKLFNAGGRLVKALHNGNERLWESEETLRIPGIYFCRMEAGNFKATSKLTVVK